MTFSGERRAFLRQFGVLASGTITGWNCLAADDARRLLRFSLSLSNPFSRTLTEQKVWLYLPVAQTATQQLSRVEIAGPHRVHYDNFGHTVLEIFFDNFGPLAQKALNFSVEVVMRSTPVLVNSQSDWSRAERFIESDAPEIIALARTLQSANPAQTARSIFNWVSQNITYAGYVADDFGAMYALRHRRGDCTEYAYLVVALARACGLQARMLGGYVVNRDYTPRADDYHNWAEIYFDGSWQLVDAQKGNWLAPTDQYVVFRYHRAEPQTQIGTAHRFRVEGELLVRV